MEYFYIRILRVCGSYGFITQADSLKEATDAVAFWRGKGDLQKGLDEGIAIFKINGVYLSTVPLPDLLKLYESFPIDQASDVLAPINL